MVEVDFRAFPAQLSLLIDVLDVLELLLEVDLLLVVGVVEVPVVLVELGLLFGLHFEILCLIKTQGG